MKSIICYIGIISAFLLLLLKIADSDKHKFEIKVNQVCNVMRNRIVELSSNLFLQSENLMYGVKGCVIYICSKNPLLNYRASPRKSEQLLREFVISYCNECD